MDYYWVNIGVSYNEVLEDGFLWAPTPYVNENKNKVSSSGWLQVSNIKKGDIVFCNRDQKLIYIVIAREDAFLAPRPDSRKFDAWKKEGVRVEVDVFNLNKPIDTKVFKDELYEKFNHLSTPKLMNVNRNFCEQYLIYLSEGAGDFLIKLDGIEEKKLKSHSNNLVQNDHKNYSFPYSAGYTWTVINENTACKKIDKTLVIESSTGIPQEIVSFFIGAELNLKQSAIIKLNINESEYEISILRKPDGRHKLLLTNMKRILKLNKLTIDTDSLWFERDSEERNQFHVYTKSINNDVAVKPKSKGKSKPNKTSRSVISDARIGQEYFKSEVTDVCNGCCVVTGVKDQNPSILIGSHTKSWADSDDEERMDGHNGLLLAPHIDKLYDRHLITFSKSGKILISKLLNPDVLVAWGIDTEKQYLLTDKQHEYMKCHREKFEKKQENT